MTAGGKRFQIALSGAFGAVAAAVVALALGDAYREGEIGRVLLSLGLPPVVLFLVYARSDKRTVFTVASAMLGAALLLAVPRLGVPREGVALLLLTLAALLVPVCVDLLFVDRGKRIAFERPVAWLAEVAFVAAVVPLGAWSVLDAHSRILEEDAVLVTEVAGRISSAPEGGAIVVDHLNPRLKERAQRRISIRTKDRTYELSDAESESVLSEYTVRKKTNTRGASRQELLTKEQEERMRLILKLQGTSIPDEVVVESRRGPLTIYEAKVALPERGS